MAQREILRLQLVNISEQLVLRVVPKMPELKSLISFMDKCSNCLLYSRINRTYVLKMGCVRYGLCLASPEGMTSLTSGARLSAVKGT